MGYDVGVASPPTSMQQLYAIIRALRAHADYRMMGRPSLRLRLDGGNLWSAASLRVTIRHGPESPAGPRATIHGHARCVKDRELRELKYFNNNLLCANSHQQHARIQGV